MTEPGDSAPNRRKEDWTEVGKAVYAKPRLTRLGLLRKITGFSF